MGDGLRVPLGTVHAGWPQPRLSPESHKHHLRSGAQGALEAGPERAAGPEQAAEQVLGSRDTRRQETPRHPPCLCPSRHLQAGAGAGRAGRKLGPQKPAAQGPGPV